jgi:hypothetical protein
VLQQGQIEKFITSWKMKRQEIASVQISYNHKSQEGFMYSKGYSYDGIPDEMYETLTRELAMLNEKCLQPLVHSLEEALGILRIYLEVDEEGVIDKENISVIADLNINRDKNKGVFELLRKVTKPFMVLADSIEGVEVVGNNYMIGRISIKMGIDTTALRRTIYREWGDREKQLHKQWMLELARVVDHCEAEYRFEHDLRVSKGEIHLEKNFEHMGMKLYFGKGQGGQLQ